MQTSNQSTRLSQLWDSVCQGSENCYATFHYHLYPGLISYARGLVSYEEVAEDLVQDLFVKMWVKKEQIGRIENVKGYMYRAIRSICFNHLKSAKKKQTPIDPLDEDFQISYEDMLAQDETQTFRKQQIERALNGLPARQREILYLRFFEKLEYEQIVEVTGVKYQSVVNHVYRATQCLRNQLRNSSTLVTVA
ncbi:RNA polymerase sigma factor [Chryseolinea soli]|uniref:Sigma-70 family RNA polymerase sigma factor n=1 Tax=Chryseolinea soli TaxID=2321403 RepID=A0A385SPR7_9BACT|nr:sigma-70 family RNA polymerase sigma factor [Chryseolinea soli]AYB31955.1 sigma-70 family RNA polymerase sigma factor [Chryseolinea soli]